VPDSEDFRFANPPLIEVIFEIHWALTPVSFAPPGGGIDPHYSVYAREIGSRLETSGFAVRQELAPSGMPVEFLGHNAMVRYRRQADSWPVIQIGPGVMTVNMVPPYEGWASFSGIAANAIAMLFDCYPMPREYLNIQMMQLRYIDAFGKTHGFDGDPNRFIRDRTNAKFSLPDTVFASAADENKVNLSAVWQVPLRDPAGSVGSVKMATGTANGEHCVIVEFSTVDNPTPPRPFEPMEIAAWLDQAHKICRSWFLSFTSPELEKAMGARIPVRSTE
jgi:uncharacterized protein (TIGR04255 family)